SALPAEFLKQVTPWSSAHLDHIDISSLPDNAPWFDALMSYGTWDLAKNSPLGVGLEQNLIHTVWDVPAPHCSDLLPFAAARLLSCARKNNCAAKGRR